MLDHPTPIIKRYSFLINDSAEKCRSFSYENSFLVDNNSIYLHEFGTTHMKKHPRYYFQRLFLTCWPDISFIFLCFYIKKKKEPYVAVASSRGWINRILFVRENRCNRPLVLQLNIYMAGGFTEYRVVLSFRRRFVSINLTEVSDERIKFERDERYPLSKFVFNGGIRSNKTYCHRYWGLTGLSRLILELIPWRVGVSSQSIWIHTWEFVIKYNAAVFRYSAGPAECPYPTRDTGMWPFPRPDRPGVLRAGLT